MGVSIDHRVVLRVQEYLLEVCTIVHNEIMSSLSYLGEQCVIKVRDRTGEASWFDQTGNLRSSIGYAILNEGRKTIESAFQQVLEGSQGAIKSREYINDLARLYSDTYALLVVAGMEYADIVEALDNKDVLGSTELWAKSQVDGALNVAKKKALSKIKPFVF